MMSTTVTLWRDNFVESFAAAPSLLHSIDIELFVARTMKRKKKEIEIENFKLINFFLGFITDADHDYYILFTHQKSEI